MARIRYLKPSFFDHDGLASISPHARLAFQGIWLHADRDGRLKDEPKRMRVRIFPYEAALDMDAMIVELESIGVLRRYQVDGVRYLFLPGFHEHQRPHPKEPSSTIPPWTNTAKHGETRPAVEGKGSIPPTTVGMGTGTGMENGNGDGDATKAAARPVQGIGASEAGSLPRDHMKHAECGPRFLICLSPAQYAKLAPRFNAGTDAANRAGVAAFLGYAEGLVGPNQSPGDFVWLLQHYDAWLASQGRIPAAPAKTNGKPQPRTAAQIIASMKAEGSL